VRRRNPPPDAGNAEFFGDRSIGKRVCAHLAGDGWNVTPMFKQWPRTENKRLDDEIWIPKVSEFGWIILAKDEFNKGRERELLRVHSARAFSIFNQRITAAEMFERFLANKQRIFELAGERGPYLYSVRPKDLRKVDLS
jgi:hypothetical protein